MKIVLNFFLFLLPVCLTGQNFTHQDTLRGSITPQRAWWDLRYYHLAVRVNPGDSTISGSNTVGFTALDAGDVMQIDLQYPMQINKATFQNKPLSYERQGNAYFIHLPGSVNKGQNEEIEVFFSGHPQVARRPPWDGGITWSRDKAGNPFVASSCQGLGASVWWPCKDHMYDEVDSMTIQVTVPDSLQDVSNGRLRKVSSAEKGWHTYTWAVVNPINNYGVNINIGDYVKWKDTLQGEKGTLDLSYYALLENEDAARSQFKQVKLMLRAFEYWFGPYPFYEDGYKIVETPYLGMEHQSSITYGNHYRNGYLGNDLSGTGWGLKFDFIIIHESAHEWFANNITYKDIADMWIHESFANYSESLYLEYYFGKQAGQEYVIGTRERIQNDQPIIGTYGVNHSGSGDMYYKGGNMLNTLRMIVNDDDKWRQILRTMNARFYHQTVTTEQIEKFLADETGNDLKAFFNQYLRDTRIPKFVYKIVDNQLQYRWEDVVTGFAMPILVSRDNRNFEWIKPTSKWQSMGINPNLKGISVDPNFYIEIENIGMPKD
ncbi:MAG: M1 family metallopeptidase [Saprospiraceae bacterium]|nr:M1 family metallopeptidase [Saprospiraceae bacterium]MCB0668928.1 M1 family metallopeptidase [Saprospiraceae bacterium]